MRKLLAIALAVGLYAPLAHAQTVIQNQISGNEVWSAAQGPGGASQWLGINTVSGRRSILTATVTGAVTLPTSLRNGGNYIVTAQPSAAVITMPPSPIINGAIIGICNPTAAAYATNAVTVAGNTNQTSPTNNTITTLGAGACASFQFNLANTTWYRIQ